MVMVVGQPMMGIEAGNRTSHQDSIGHNFLEPCR